eukprot:TRINITY_DN5144_c0_g1_i2.p2 TRINITY_DN5144_c0_g1~~TRINITY_DN5144_c0_g1_i2.p2  ORF type:complete len:179 (+),score=0.82 TRINITY_DN5144_c0_g1_i2:1145-1681(+)
MLRARRQLLAASHSLTRAQQSNHQLAQLGCRSLSHAASSSPAITSSCGKYQLANRNPRSAELLRTKPKPQGFDTSSTSISFYHRIRLHRSNKHLTAYVDTPDRTIILTATTQEYNIARHLYGYADKSAAQNLADVTAQRLHESGITALKFERGDAKFHGRIKLFVTTLIANGIEVTLT